jgi:hypothetical protein
MSKAYIFIPIDERGVQCDHVDKPTIHCQACDREYREELLRYWSDRSELFDRSTLPTGVPIEC